MTFRFTGSNDRSIGLSGFGVNSGKGSNLGSVGLSDFSGSMASDASKPRIFWLSEGVSNAEKSWLTDVTAFTALEPLELCLLCCVRTLCGLDSQGSQVEPSS